MVKDISQQTSERAQMVNNREVNEWRRGLGRVPNCEKLRRSWPGCFWGAGFLGSEWW
jgi:hypothetical protein